MTNKQPNWYAVSRNGMATLCKDQADADKTAFDGDRDWPRMSPHHAVQLVDAVVVERLTAELEAALKSEAVYCQLSEDAKPFAQSNIALRAELEALRKDAERYRWLRSDDIEVLPGQREICVVQSRLPHTEDADVTLTESALDAAIDKAIAQAVQA